MDTRCLDKTELLDYDDAAIQKIIEESGWIQLPLYQRIGAVYDYVQNDILFGYNETDAMPASRILQEGYGQCNTKAILLMALLRGVDVPCRLHGFTIDKKLQQGIMPPIVYKNAPDSIVHSWVEVEYEDKWIVLEGVILDLRYLKNLQLKNKNVQGLFCGWGVADTNFQNPQVEWKGTHTYIQREGINHDYGIFNSPDAFFRKYPQKMSGIQRTMYLKLGRKLMNQQVQKIRDLKYVDQYNEKIK
ncbi:MAG: transglutaminase family protein [Lachnospiraceae bacterium]|nr:transglutaminase family protein [Lachnospiraceae bacterium]